MSDGGQIDSKTLDTIIGAYFPQFLSEPSTARTRAQAAYAIASATAAALVTAGVLGDIGSFPWPVQVLAVLAVAAWVFGAYRFMEVSRDVTRRRVRTDEEVKELEPGEWAKTVLKRARDDAKEIDRRLGEALKVTAIALILTVVAFAAVLVFPAQPGMAQATIDLTVDGARAVDDLCSLSPTQLTGDLEIGSLDDDYVVIDVPKGGCKPDKDVEVRIPPADVEAVVSEDRGWIPFAD